MDKAWCNTCEWIEDEAHFRYGHERGPDVSCEDCGCCHCSGKCKGEHNCFAKGCECSIREEPQT